MRNKPGGAVEDDDEFFNREAEVQILLEHIKDGNSTLISAPRRVGKTSLMRRLKLLISQDQSTSMVNFEGQTTPAEAVRSIIRSFADENQEVAVPKSLIATVLSAVGIDTTRRDVNVGGINIELGHTVTDDNWKEIGENFFRSVAKHATQQGESVVFFFDELSVLVDTMLEKPFSRSQKYNSQVREFLHWLRGIRQAERANLTFIVSGSIGLEPLLKGVGMTATINDLTKFQLKEWTEPTAVAFLEKVAETYDIKLDNSDEPLRQICKNLGLCIPHHVQVYFSQIRQRLIKDQNSVLTNTVVDKVYAEEMLSPTDYADLRHMFSRLERHETQVGQVSEEIISFLSTKKTPCSVTEIAQGISIQNSAMTDANVRSALDLLEHDGYLSVERKKYKIRSTFIQDWWENNIVT